MSRRSREVLSGLAVVVLFALPLLPEILGARRLIFRDAQITHWPWRRAAVEMLAAGEAPFVDAHSSGGQPLLANPNAVLLYPTFLLERVLPPDSAFNLHYLLHVIWAFFGARALGRRLELSDGAAFFAGVAFAFSGMMLSYGSAFMNSAAAAAWLPWCVAAALDLARPSEARRALRAAAALGIGWGLQLLAGEPAISLLTGAMAACLATGATLVAPQGSLGKRMARLAAGFGAAALLALAFSAPLLLPLRGVLPLTFRGQHLYSKEAFGAVPLRPGRLLEWIFPRWNGNPSIAGMDTTRLQTREAGLTVYIWCVTFGVIPLCVFLAGAVRATFWRTRALALSAIAVVSLLLSFGFLLPFYRILFAIEALRRMRYPIKFYLLTSLCVALLAGLGAQSLAKRRLGRRETALLAAVGAALAAVWILAAPGGPIVRAILARAVESYVPFVEALRSSVRADAFAGLLAVVCVGAWLRWRPASGNAGYALGVLTLLSALAWGLPLFVSAPSQELARVPALARLVAGPGRLYCADTTVPQLRWLEPDYPRRLPRVVTFARRQIEHLFPATGAPFGVRYLFEMDPDGSYGFYNRVASEAARASTPEEADRLLRLFGARWVLAREDEPHPLFRAQTGLSIGPERLVLFEHAHPLPELRWAGRLYRRRSLSATLELVRSESFEPVSDIALPGPRDEDPTGPGSVGSLRETLAGASFARAEIEADGNGYLIFSRTFFPAWKGRVDGVSSP
ncbi:MAG: hypothetical protein ABI968_04260, partial [Acidobacteriota bacterium]